ncbi:MAG: Uma2 family endonuclease [Dorea sp.]|nr:Uma2 family endonuclease [Dorea sp.]
MKAEPDERYVIGGNMVMKKEETGYTIRDIEALSENERAELIDGKIYWMATPTTTHQRILNFLNFEFYRYVKEKQGDCEVFISPFAVYLNETSTYVEPDLVVVCDGGRIDEKGCHGGPDLVIEIVSESSRRLDYVIKLFKYRMYGVREYWVVDPAMNRVQVYDLAKDNLREYTLTDQVPVGIYGGELVIDFSER